MHQKLPNGFELVRSEHVTPGAMFPYFEGSQLRDDNIFNMIPPQFWTNTTKSGPYSPGSLSISLKSNHGFFLSSLPGADESINIMSVESQADEKFSPFEHTMSSIGFQSQDRFLYCDTSNLAKSKSKHIDEGQPSLEYAFHIY